MSFDVKDKVALVTGANRGIGKAITETLLKHGAAKVYAAVRDPESAKPLVEAHGDKVVPVKLDLIEPDSIKAAAKKASDVTLVINNGGVFRKAAALSEDTFEAMTFEMNVNVYGLLRMAQTFAPVLKSNGGGAFVQLNSIASLTSFPDFTTYCASKAAAYSITQALRVLLGEQGTQVVSVHPGPIDTDMGDAAGFQIAAPPEDVANEIITALKSGEFHAFPDPAAKEVGEAYASFAKAVVESDESLE